MGQLAAQANLELLPPAKIKQKKTKQNLSGQPQRSKASELGSRAEVSTAWQWGQGVLGEGSHSS